MPLKKIDHCAIRTECLEQTREFYVNILGLTQGARPDLPVPGYWLYAEGEPIVHLIEIGEKYHQDVYGDPLGDTDLRSSGSVDHLAFRVTDHPALMARIEKHQVPYKESFIEEMGLRQVFLTDPNGVTAELNFFQSEQG